MLNKIDNNGVHIESIMRDTSCSNHNSEAGTPCWSVWVGSTKRFAPAVCGGRIRRAGFTGKITPSSLSRWASNKPDPKGRPNKSTTRPSSAKPAYNSK